MSDRSSVFQLDGFWRFEVDIKIKENSFNVFSNKRFKTKSGAIRNLAKVKGKILGVFK